MQEHPTYGGPGGPVSNRPDVLIIDDGELILVRKLLRELGVAYWHLAGKSIQSLPEAKRVLIASSKLASRLRLSRTRPKPGEGPTWIAVVPSGSKSQSRVLRQAGFDFLVPDNVHPAPLRLLLARGIYDGANTQRVRRVPFGGEATYVSRLIRHKVMLVDISPRGCRFLTKRPPRRGADITIQIPCGDSPLQLSGKVVRLAPGGQEGGAVEETSVGMHFAPITGIKKERLKALLLEHWNGPQAYGDLSRVRYHTGDDNSVLDTSAGQPRAVFDQSVDAFCTGTTRVLVSRDLSEGGLRVEPGSGLQVGTRLRLALPVGKREEPVLIEAHVARDEGEKGMVIFFDWMDQTERCRLKGLIETLPKIHALRDDTATHTAFPVGLNVRIRNTSLGKKKRSSS